MLESVCVEMGPCEVEGGLRGQRVLTNYAIPQVRWELRNDQQSLVFNEEDRQRSFCHWQI